LLQLILPIERALQHTMWRYVISFRWAKLTYCIYDFAICLQIYNLFYKFTICSQIYNFATCLQIYNFQALLNHRANACSCLTTYIKDTFSILRSFWYFWYYVDTFSIRRSFVFLQGWKKPFLRVLTKRPREKVPRWSAAT
jgi:hypothetical protein